MFGANFISLTTFIELSTRVNKKKVECLKKEGEEKTNQLPLLTSVPSVQMNVPSVFWSVNPIQYPDGSSKVFSLQRKLNGVVYLI